TTPTRIDNLNSIHSRTVLFDVNKDSQCQIRQFLQGGPPRMRTAIRVEPAGSAPKTIPFRQCHRPAFRQEANEPASTVYVFDRQSSSLPDAGATASVPSKMANDTVVNLSDGNLLALQSLSEVTSRGVVA
ncbi:hypothetical protein, partial [Microvirga tunisiensis]|uniref:hypothetical protein n=1 Tax=Microvirga tunisiensis TaxID=2108360 RepID=UPI001AED1A2A